MTTRKHQIVAAIPAEGESPVVLFDFDEWFTLGVGTDFSPPEVRDSSTWTQLEDGNTSGASTLGDRVIRLVLTQFRGNAEDQAEVLQTLGRLLDDSRGQWFLWQDEGTVHERFFRTKRASVPVEDHYLLERPKRTLNLTIPAEPKAKGRRVEGSVVITNNPLAGANPLVAELPAIKGDVSAPLWIEAVFSYDAGIPVGLGSLAVPPGMVVDAPFWLDVSDMTPEAGTGYAWSVVSDPVFIGGSARRLTQDAGTPTLTSQTVLSSTDVLQGIPPGDYRVFMRGGVKSVLGPDPVFGTVLRLGNGTLTYVVDGPTVTSASGGSGGFLDMAWLDMGIVRLPTAYPELSPAYETIGIADGRTDFGLMVSDGKADAELTIEGFLYVPVGLDLGIDATWSTMTRYYADTTIIVDGLADQITPLQADGNPANILARFDGWLPRVTPGADNYIHTLSGVISPFSESITNDPITTTITLNYAYLPEYLYIRSATG